jgi:hypothetical protein
MNLIPVARTLVDHLTNLPGFVVFQDERPTEQSMGAVIADAVLQAGLNYRTVVAPRVERIAREYPEAATTSGFIALAGRIGFDKLLRWDHPEKPRRAHSVAFLLHQE